MMRLLNWVVGIVTFWFKLFIFLGVLLLLFIYGVVHALLFGGPVMPDDMWFLSKVLFLILLPVVLSVSMKGKAPLFIGLAASALLGSMMSWGTYTHAPQFWEAKAYSIENGKLFVPEENRGELMRDCGFIGHEGMKDTCQIIVYCQSYDAAAYERMGCEELLRKSTSPAVLDLAMQERRSYEYEHR